MNIKSKNKIRIDKSFKIEAGPGAGKTEFLVNHIKNVLQNSNLLGCTRKVTCITYTNTAVDTILKRLGQAASDKVEVSTIHSFLYKNVVKPYCSFIPEEYQLCSSKIKGHDDFYISSKYIREWFENDDLNSLKHPNTKKQILTLPVLNQALQNWLKSMQCTYKNNSVSFECDNQKALVYDKKTGKLTRINASNLKILSRKILGLKKVYWRKGRLDHNDVLYFSYVLINKFPFILDVLSAKFPYIFIDEYQDTNPIQSFVLDEIRKKDIVVGVIGDKSQSIYKFQGADPSMFDSFKVDADSSYTISDNHRSTNQIVKLLNDIRGDICQIPCKNIDNIEATIFVGSSNEAYFRACGVCSGEKVVSLSRDNIGSNAMKKEIEGNALDKYLLEQFLSQDSVSQRRKCILSFIQSVELAVNRKYKDAIKSIEWIFKDEDNPKKIALMNLSKLLKEYNKYTNGTLMMFYDTICRLVNIKLSGFKKGATKNFYEKTPYKSMAICINIIDDTSNHITIHKAKGAEYENVILLESKNIMEFLLSPDLFNNEEHRIIYVALSRAENRLFIQIANLDDDNEKRIREKYSYLNIQRI